ncbi:hypothetical protein [Streptomyces sp. NBC_00670]|uniref:hypothetical protein n=1 Tax=Streptomyces sp. NBC_00670 TaxID=2975804 RepID=UPI002E3005D7|nr:hypothetical protein [Streptomyces sp. NBC_00670]
MTRRRHWSVRTIAETLTALVPGAVQAATTVTVTHTTRRVGAPPLEDTWTGSPVGVAERIAKALYGRGDELPPQSPLQTAEDAKRARDLGGELSALRSGHHTLTSASWYPARPGDLVHIHYEGRTGRAAYGETYIVGPAEHGMLSMQLLAHTLPEASGDGAEVTGAWYATEESADPLAEVWMEAGPHRLTIVRDGRPVHIGGGQ